MVEGQAKPSSPLDADLDRARSLMPSSQKSRVHTPCNLLASISMVLCIHEGVDVASRRIDDLGSGPGPVGTHTLHVAMCTPVYTT